MFTRMGGCSRVIIRLHSAEMDLGAGDWLSFATTNLSFDKSERLDRTIYGNET